MDDNNVFDVVLLPPTEDGNISQVDQYSLEYEHAHLGNDVRAANNEPANWHEPAFDPNAFQPMIKVSHSANIEQLPLGTLMKLLASLFPGQGNQQTAASTNPEESDLEDAPPQQQVPASSEGSGTDSNRRYAFHHRIFKANPNPVDNHPPKSLNKLPEDAEKLTNGIETENWEPGVKFLTIQGLDIPLSEIRTIYGNVLSSQVVSAYMEMLVHRSQTNQELPNVHAVDPSLCRFIALNGADKAIETFGHYDVIDKELIFFPFFWRGYWSLTIFDFKNKTVDNFDIFKKSISQPVVDSIVRFVAKSHSQMDFSEWEHWIMRHRQDFPVYERKESGVLILQVADWFSQRQGLEKPDFNYIRKKLVLELYQQKFHN